MVVNMKNRVILHVDVNNAFLSWSAVWLLKNGYKVDIRNRFAVIGGDEKKRRGKETLREQEQHVQKLRGKTL